MDKVTIVIPIYNPRFEFLCDLFDSIQKQDYPNFDVVISDDGCDEEKVWKSVPAGLKSRIRYVTNPGRRGIFSNLNNALRIADSDCIQLFCQDDVMLPGLLRANYEKISDERQLVFSNFDSISASNEVLPNSPEVTRYIPSLIKSSEANNFFLYFGCIPGNLSPVMFTKSLLSQTGFFNETYQYIGDFDFWVRAARYTNLYFNKEKQLLIRRHVESASNSLGTLQRFLELRKLMTYLIENNSLQLSKNILRQYIHIHLFRSVMLHLFRNAFNLNSVNISLFRRVFDGNPFSMRLALRSFLTPVPAKCKPLQQVMEVYRP